MAQRPRVSPRPQSSGRPFADGAEAEAVGDVSESDALDAGVAVGAIAAEAETGAIGDGAGAPLVAHRPSTKLQLVSLKLTSVCTSLARVPLNPSAPGWRGAAS